MKALVTGGGGFLGSAVVELLLRRGGSVRNFSRGYYPELEANGVEQFRGDLADREAVGRACANCDIVFHTAAKAGLWGPFPDFYEANVTGTRNVISACRDLGISRLVYTSSPSVVFNGEDMEGADESVPYATHFKSPYPATKAEAEKMVREANGPTLATVALRPHLIWGPRDTHLVPGILERGRAGKIKKLGKEPKSVDFTYITNAAQAHLQAADRLTPDSPIAGRAYFITNGEPVVLWDFINRLLAAADIPPVAATVPPRLAYCAGWLSETVWRTLHLSGEPPMTRFLAEELGTSHWFNIDAARRDLGYRPEVSMEEGLRRLKQWLDGDTPSDTAAPLN
ncbi:MAG: NAD-dependent epimerase/dehydratase family protein [Acidobacteria bacterium]|nr:MAG: NAD-dependent epimerase/dehydratase family protein [Acidobacteriota bacterium]